jgi:hypothetical protein
MKACVRNWWITILLFFFLLSHGQLCLSQDMGDSNLVQTVETYLSGDGGTGPYQLGDCLILKETEKVKRV